jgi:hypothetical protein
MKNSVFLDKIPCSLVEVYQLHCLQNVCKLLSDFTASHPRRHDSYYADCLLTFIRAACGVCNRNQRRTPYHFQINVRSLNLNCCAYKTRQFIHSGSKII